MKKILFILLVLVMSSQVFAQRDRIVRESMLTDSGGVIGYELGLDFNGDRTVKRTGLPLINVATSTTLMAFIEEYFFPYINATISLTTDSTIFEIGGHYLIDLSADITANEDTTFTHGYIRRVSPSADTLVNWSTDTLMTNTPTYEPVAKETYQYEAGTTRDSINVTRDGTEVITNTTYHYAVYPQFWGDTTLAFAQGNTIPYNATFTKSVIREPSSVERSYVAPQNEYLYFIYPNGDGLLSALAFNSAGSYYDDSDAWSNFTVTIISNSLTNDYTETFRVYKTDLVKNTTETLTFRFTF